MDNWTLQNAGELLCNGLSGDTAHDLVFSASGKSFKYAETSEDIVRFEALCQVLSNIVFADQLFVDAAFVSTWSELGPIKQLHGKRILFPKPFQDISDQWTLCRESIADELCVNAVLLKKHRANKRSYSANGTSADPLLAQLLWGGAGMLARASHFGLPYAPHPLREQLFRRVRFLSGPSSADIVVKDFVNAQRLKISERLDGSGFLARMKLPAIAVLVIQESNNMADLIPVALQLRGDFRRLRAWLGKFQAAFDKEDTKAILAERKKLESVARYVDSLINISPVGDTSVQFGLGWLKLATKTGSPLNSLRNVFGVRAELNRLILAPAGRKSLKKLLRLLGEEKTRCGLSFEKALAKRFSNSAPLGHN